MKLPIHLLSFYYLTSLCIGSSSQQKSIFFPKPVAQKLPQSSNSHGHLFLLRLQLVRRLFFFFLFPFFFFFLPLGFLHRLYPREPTPEWDPIAAYEALAPLHWDAEEFDFGVASEENKPTTEGEEDLQFLLQEELESSEDDAFSWEGADSSEEIGSSSSDDTAAGGNPHQFLKAPMKGSEEGSSSAGERSSSTGNDGSNSGDDDDGGDAPSRSPKRRRNSDTYDW